MIKIHKQQQDFVKHYQWTSNHPGVCAAAHVGSVNGNNQNSLKTYKAPVSLSAQLRLGKQIHGYVIFPFSVLTLLAGRQEGIQPVKKLGVGLLVVRIWLELRTAYSSSCHHCFYHSLLRWTMANPGSLGKWPLKRRERLPMSYNRSTWNSVLEEGTELRQYDHCTLVMIKNKHNIGLIMTKHCIKSQNVSVIKYCMWKNFIDAMCSWEIFLWFSLVM